MSSTHRSNCRSLNDFYGTPPYCVGLIWPHVRTSGPILDPCAGDGSMVRFLRAQSPTSVINAIEIDAERAPRVDGANSVIRENFLLMPTEMIPQAELVITNPPYSKAIEFVERSLSVATRTVAMLLRLNFLGSMKRYEFFRSAMPDVYVISKRPSFTDGGTDSCEYAWFVWNAGISKINSPGLSLRPFGKITVLA